MNDKSPSPSRRAFTLVELAVVILIIAAIIALFFPATRGVNEATRRTACLNNLKQIGLALHNYHDDYGTFPPPYTVDADGNRLHSWRTLILPFTDHAALYEKIDLSKPWDDPANAAAMAENPYVYSCPSAIIPAGHTVYHGVVSADGFFHPAKVRTLDTIADDQKLAIVEVDASRAVPWMSPHDEGHEFFQSLTAETQMHHTGISQVLHIDGHSGNVPLNTPKQELREMITVTETDPPPADSAPPAEDTP